MPHDWLVWAGVQVPGSLGDCCFCFRRAGVLTDVFSPRRDQHFRSKRSGIFQVLVHPVQKSAVPQKDQTKLFSQ
jgi:hypothetical protein